MKVETILYNLIDNLTAGFAKDVLVGDLVDKYQIEYSLAREAVERLSNEVSQIGEDLNAINDLKATIRNRSYGANPLGQTYLKMKSQLNALDQEAKVKSSRYTQATQELNKQTRKMDEYNDKRNATLGELMDTPREVKTY